MNPTKRHATQQAIAILSAVLLLTAGPGSPVAARAQTADAAPSKMSHDQLDKLVSPVALYPDPLLAQVLAASTYPSDVVEADHWVKQNKNLKGQQLTDAVVKANLPYDPSIISLIQFPTVLDKLSKESAWTTSLGDAFLTQRGDVIDAIQRMRRKAESMGNLKSNEQIKVVSNPQVIEIQPAKPEVIYVPAYNPQVVYVQAAPPPPPPGPSTGAVVATGLISFGLGVAVGAAASNNSCCWYGGSVGWSSRTVVVANTPYNRTWATRGAIPPPPPYYRAGGPYPVGRPPIGGTYNNVNINRNVNVNNVNSNNTSVNNVNRNNVNNANRNNANVNNANVNNVNRNATNANNMNRNATNANNVNRNNTNANSSIPNRGNATSAGANTANRSAATAREPAANSNRAGGGGSDQPAGNRARSQPAAGERSSGAQKRTSERQGSQRGQADRGNRDRDR
jgi:hypothetical protein